MCTGCSNHSLLKHSHYFIFCDSLNLVADLSASSFVRGRDAFTIVKICSIFLYLKVLFLMYFVSYSFNTILCLFCVYSEDSCPKTNVLMDKVIHFE